MRDFHIFWMQYGMDHYLFLHLIAFIIEQYSVLNDNKVPLLRRPNTKCVTASAQLLSVAFHVSPTPWAEWAAHPRLPRREGQGQSPTKREFSCFPEHPCPLLFWYFTLGSWSTEDAPAAAGDGVVELPGAGSRLKEGTRSKPCFFGIRLNEGNLLLFRQLGCLLGQAGISLPLHLRGRVTKPGPDVCLLCCLWLSRNAFFNGLLQLLIKRAFALFINYLLTLCSCYKPITDIGGVLPMLISSSAAIAIDGFKQSADLFGPATID